MRKRVSVRATTGCGETRIAGEWFRVHWDDGGFALTHAQWSLMGEGATLDEAKADLLNEARQLTLVDGPGSPQLEALRAFVHRVSPPPAAPAPAGVCVDYGEALNEHHPPAPADDDGDLVRVPLGVARDPTQPAFTVQQAIQCATQATNSKPQAPQ
jgi:hypothetical protein